MDFLDCHRHRHLISLLLFRFECVGGGFVGLRRVRLDGPRGSFRAWGKGKYQPDGKLDTNCPRPRASSLP